MDIKQSSESIGHFVEKTFDNILTRPTYQRGFNWNEVKVSNFIMTIMMCGYVQPLLLYRYHEDDVIEDKKFEIIDGQHRAASIKAFMKGEPIIGKKHKQIMAYVKKDGYYMFYNKTKHVEEWEKKTGHKATYFTDGQREKFTEYDVNYETCRSRLTLEERRRLFGSLQEGVPVRNSDKLKNNMDCEIVKQLNEDYPSWEKDYITNYLPLLTSNKEQNRLFCVIRLYAIFDNPTNAKIYRDLTDIDIRKKITDLALPSRTRPANEFKNIMDIVYARMAELKETDTKYTPMQLFALCTEIFENQYNAVQLTERCKDFIEKGKNIDVKANKQTKSLWFDDVDKNIKQHIAGAYYEKCKEFLLTSRSKDISPSSPDRRKWGKCTREFVWATYNGERERGICYTCDTEVVRTSLGWERGHNIAHSVGGSSCDIDNLKVICKNCNNKQGTQTFAEFKKSQEPV